MNFIFNKESKSNKKIWQSGGEGVGGCVARVSDIFSESKSEKNCFLFVG